MNTPTVARWSFRCVALSVAAAASWGCAGPRLYMVDMELESRRVVQTANPLPAAEVRDLMKTATTLAFNPPDSCTDVKAAGAGATEISNVMRLQCGVLMTELETAATRAGFSVVSWQTLRRTNDSRPIDFARANNVDLLFEVNELSFDLPVQEQWGFTNMTFTQREERDLGTSPLVVADTMAIARRCQDQYWKTAQPAQSATLDVKMVSVSDGRVQWTYRDTRADNTAERLKVKRTWRVLPQNSSNPLLPLGAVGIGVGLGLVIAPELSSDADVGFKQTFQTIGAVTAGVGAAVLIASFFLPATYSRADDVLCVGSAEEDQAAPQAVGPTSGASVSFTEQRSLGSGDAEQRRKKLLNEVIRQFIETVSAMKR